MTGTGKHLGYISGPAWTARLTRLHQITTSPCGGDQAGNNISGHVPFGHNGWPQQSVGATFVAKRGRAGESLIFWPGLRLLSL